MPNNLECLYATPTYFYGFYDHKYFTTTTHRYRERTIFSGLGIAKHFYTYFLQTIH